MMKNEGYYLGIDLGTSSLKATLASYDGEIITHFVRKCHVISPHINWTEQDPNERIKNLKSILKEIKNEGYSNKILGISFSGQMHGLVILDQDDNPIRPVILWNDQRTSKEVDYLNNNIGKDILIEETSNIALCGFTASKILWIKNNEPENFKRIKKIMLPKDYLSYYLTGIFESDVSDLSGTNLFDIKSNDYSKKMLDIIGLKREQLPKVLKSFDVVGFLKEEIVKKYFLNPKCKIVIGGGDQAVGAIGTNTIKDNSLFISLGTSGVVFSSMNKYMVDKKGRIHSFRNANNTYLLMGCTLACCDSLNWWIKDILGKKNVGEEINKIPDAISEELFLPYLIGERSPINDPFAKGIFSNLSLKTTKETMIKTVLEGISFSLYDNFLVMKELGLKPLEARVIGGGSKADRWIQLLADIFGIKMKRIATNEGAGLGAIILAMVGCGRFSSIEEATNKLIKDK